MKNLYLLLLLLCQGLYSQTGFDPMDYEWEAQPNYDMRIDESVSMLSLKERYITNFVFEGDNSFVEYYLEHKAVLLNSNENIESYNKLYLPYSASSELLKLKGRVITRSGNILEVDDSQIFEAKDEETGRQYKYMAFEGIQKGSIIEYYYVQKKPASIYGTSVRFQSDYDKRDVRFDLYAPKHLIFDFKSYNGIPEVIRDTTSTDVLHWSLQIDRLEGIPEEEQAPYNALRGMLIYKLDRNTAKNNMDISSYGPVAQNLYDFYYKEWDDKLIKKLDKFLEEAGAVKDKSETTVRNLDRLIKTTFVIAESDADSFEDLGEILSKKVANSSGFVRLYVALFQQLGIPFELVLTTDRTELKFDPEFEAHNFLNNYLVYLPEFDTYMSPENFDTRYGYPPSELTDNFGLFIKEVSVGAFKSGVGEIKYIEPVAASKTIDQMVVDITFDKTDITTNSISMERSISGYYAMQMHPYVHKIQGEDRKKFYNSLGESMSEAFLVESGELQNEAPEWVGEKPLKIILDMRSETLVEKAGKKYLFNIGAVIGQQIQMYQEKKRVLPYENDFNRSYLRTITVTLPDGYHIANPEELNIKNEYEERGEQLFSFHSYYELTGNKLKITADEYYRENKIRPDIYEEFRKVINSAADFNKITLVLEPES